MSATRQSWIDRVLRRLVRLLPAEFRADFGQAIEADLDERRADGDRRGLVLRDLPTLAWTVMREHVSVLRQDVTYAVRSMRRTPGFTVLAVLMLALGTGVNAAVFSVIDTVMLRSAFVDADRIAILRRQGDRGWTAAIPRARLEALQAAPGPLAAIGVLDGGSHVLTGIDEPRRLDVECISASMFDVLGTRPLIGRAFTAADDRPGAAATAVISHKFWQSLGGTPELLGTTIGVNLIPVTIVGVMPLRFAGPLTRSDTEAWLPVGRPVAGGGWEGCQPSDLLNAFVRVADGVNVAAASAAWPDLSLLPLLEQTFYETRTPFLILVGAVLCVLLIACLNVGGLQLERGLARRRELAMRVALGASRGRLVRQAVTENVLLGLVGAVAGLVATTLAMGSIVSILPGYLPHVEDVAVNGRVLAFTMAVATVAGLVAGVVPVGLIRRVAPARELAGSARVGGRATSRGRLALVAVEVALSVVVLVGASLMIQTFLTLRPTHPGFDPAGRLRALITLPGADDARSRQFFDALFARLGERAGARVEGSTYVPLSGSVTIGEITAGEAPVRAYVSAITDGYLELMRIAVLQGRGFTAADTDASARVVMVNDVLARRLRPDGQVVGEEVDVLWHRRNAEPIPVRHRIVGIAAGTRFAPSDPRPRSEAYLAVAQHPTSSLHVILALDGRRDEERARDLRAAVRSLDPTLVIGDVERMENRVHASVNRWRFGAWLLGVFAALAIVLAAIGLMTTVGWWVRQRTREIGVRVALGATAMNVTRLVLRQGLFSTGVGIIAGSVAAAGLTGFLEGWIFGVEPLDPATFATCAAGMLLVAVAAILAPVWRATRIDPLEALR
ncbi:MAG TPA: ADOP family duplicated permease, partial [Vicinamibacterales bacterium]|nr:ADOP family duplicated permease [Vicinamibacterales bacterium]